MRTNDKWGRTFLSYDFTVIQSLMSDNGEFSSQIGLGAIANDAAVILQQCGAITPYKVTVDFWTTRGD